MEFLKPALRIDVISLFPEMFDALSSSIPGRGSSKGKLVVRTHTPRDETEDVHRTVDDAPFGGGGGMVLKPEPVFKTVERVKRQHGDGRVILMSPQGVLLTQKSVERLAELDHWIVICGHYKGVDERIRDHLVDEEVSVGDYIVSGGEFPAMILIDAAIRLVPGVVGNAETVASDSITRDLLDHPHYTRPAVFRGWSVPDVLISGNHKNVETWRRQKRLERTLKRRPELLKDASLTESDVEYLKRHGWSMRHGDR